MRGATIDWEAVIKCAGISIHAPHAGSDLSRDTWRLDTFKISIHAPHAGSDQSLLNNAII